MNKEHAMITVESPIKGYGDSSPSPISALRSSPVP